MAEDLVEFRDTFAKNAAQKGFLREAIRLRKIIAIAEDLVEFRDTFAKNALRKDSCEKRRDQVQS